MPDLAAGYQSNINVEQRDKILTAAIFMIHNDGGKAYFSELSGITSEMESSEYMEAAQRGPVYGRFLGRAKPPMVTLRRSMSTGPDSRWVWVWHTLARQAAVAAYRTTHLSLYRAGQTTDDVPVKTYTLVNAFPMKVEIAGMKAGATEVVLQTVTLQCDEITEL